VGGALVVAIQIQIQNQVLEWNLDPQKSGRRSNRWDQRGGLGRGQGKVGVLLEMMMVLGKVSRRFFTISRSTCTTNCASEMTVTTPFCEIRWPDTVPVEA
jgi:hypothetical protein